MRMIVDMTAVASCSVEGCAFNQERKCHAKAITIGNTTNPACDTFHPSSRHINNIRRVAGVGACKTTDCVNNEDFECKDREIHVRISGGHNVCMSYQRRMTQ